MVRVPTKVSAAERARWLGELSDALDRAQALIWGLGGSVMRDADTLDLAARVEAARAEVRSLRLARLAEPGAEDHPEWTKQTLWNQSEADRNP